MAYKWDIIFALGWFYWFKVSLSSQFRVSSSMGAEQRSTHRTIQEYNNKCANENEGTELSNKNTTGNKSKNNKFNESFNRYNYDIFPTCFGIPSIGANANIRKNETFSFPDIFTLFTPQFPDLRMKKTTWKIDSR